MICPGTKIINCNEFKDESVIKFSSHTTCEKWKCSTTVLPIQKQIPPKNVLSSPI